MKTATIVLTQAQVDMILCALSEYAVYVKNHLCPDYASYNPEGFLAFQDEARNLGELGAKINDAKNRLKSA